MLRRKIAESLTIRIFLITAAILLFAVGATFALIAWATPLTYTAVVNEDLTRLTKNLAEALSNTDLKDSGPLLDAFVRSAGADVTLLDADGQAVDTGSKLALSPRSVANSAETTRDDTDAEETGVTWVTDIGGEQEVAFTFSEQDTIACEVQLADQTERCILYVTPRVKAENLAVRALLQMAPWLVLVLTVVSLVCAHVYSRCITRPIVRLSGIAGRMAELDFGWVCREKRRDEIGALDKAERQLKASLGYLPQDFGLFDELTVVQFLDYMAALKGLRAPKAAIETAVHAVNLEEKAKAKIRTLSGGQRQRVGIAQALLGDPALLIFDEPTVGLDPEERIHFRNLFSKTAENRLVLLSTHIIDDVQSVCGQLIVIDGGRILFAGTPEKLIQLAAGHVGSFWEQEAAREQGLHITARVNTGRGVRCRAVADSLPAYAQPEEPSLEDAYLYLISGEVRR